MTNATNKTRSAEILNTIESDLWRAVDAGNDAEDSRFQDEWEREDMMVGKWFNRMVECGKFHKDSANSQVVKDALEELWSDTLPGIIKTQAAVFYDTLEDSDLLGDYEALLASFYYCGEVDRLFSIQINDSGDDVEITANEDFAGYMEDFVADYVA